MATPYINENIRYEPDENPPTAVAWGSGFQAVTVILAPVVLIVVIVARIAAQSEDYISWGVFAVLVINGLTTVLQAVRVGRFGSGHILMMGSSGVFIAVCVTALVVGGPSTMATLIIVSALFQFALAARLSLMRRIFTPTISGTVVMLIAATVMPHVFDSLTNVPEGTPPLAAPAVALVALVTVIALILRAPAKWRLWAPLLGITAGCAVSLPFGLYDLQNVVAAPWIGLPQGTWPGFNLSFDVKFWALLPAFVVATLVGAIKTIGDGVAIQRVSRRRPGATDFRVVQGALNVAGLGNLLSGLAGTLPNTTYSTSISLTEVTGIASRRVGIVIGVGLAVLAFVPKVAALLIAIPSPVVSAYVTVLLGLLFVQGMKMVVQDGADYRKAAIVGLSFWVGVGFQNQSIFPELLGTGFLSILLGNGMTAGAIFAIVMMAFIELTGRRSKRMRVDLDTSALPQIDEFLRGLAAKSGWDTSATERLTAAAEETLAVLMQGDDIFPEGAGRRLVLATRMEGHAAEMEFISAVEGENVEDRLAYLGELSPVPDEHEVSFRLLRHYSSSVRHQKYHGIDIITVNVDARR